jgi:hypothetical protein
MSNDIETQVSSIELTQLKLNPTAFTAAIPPGKIGWTSDNHWGLLESLMPHLKDDTGKPATISRALENILRLIFQPKEDIEKEVLRQAFADAGYVLEEATANTLIMMFSAPQFADFLAKTNNPKTKRPFIEKETKRGVKKSTFAALIQAPESEPVAEETQAAEEETQTEEEQAPEPPKPAKPAATKPKTTM